MLAGQNRAQSSWNYRGRHRQMCVGLELCEHMCYHGNYWWLYITDACVERCENVYMHQFSTSFTCTRFACQVFYSSDDNIAVLYVNSPLKEFYFEAHEFSEGEGLVCECFLLCWSYRTSQWPPVLLYNTLVPGCGISPVLPCPRSQTSLWCHPNTLSVSGKQLNRRTDRKRKRKRMRGSYWVTLRGLLVATDYSCCFLEHFRSLHFIHFWTFSESTGKTVFSFDRSTVTAVRLELLNKNPIVMWFACSTSSGTVAQLLALPPDTNSKELEAEVHVLQMSQTANECSWVHLQK